MKTARLKIPTIILAVVALVVGVSSGAVAAKLITGADVKDGSLTSADIKNGTLTTTDLKKAGVNGNRLTNGSVGKDKIKDGAITSSKIKDGAVTSGKIQDGAIGPQDLSSVVKAGLPTQISDLSGLFTVTNPTVTMTPDGVNYGPYANGGAIDQGGSLVYNGLNGEPLNAVKNLVYYARYVADNDTSGVGSPYLRVWTESNANDAVFTPQTQTPDPDIAQGSFHEWVATSGTWRYNDDLGNGAEESFAALLAAHGTETISRVTITTGFSGGTNLQALLRWMQINGQTFNFGG